MTSSVFSQDSYRGRRIIVIKRVERGWWFVCLYTFHKGDPLHWRSYRKPNSPTYTYRKNKQNKTKENVPPPLCLRSMRDRHETTHTLCRKDTLRPLSLELKCKTTTGRHRVFESSSEVNSWVLSDDLRLKLGSYMWQGHFHCTSQCQDPTFDVSSTSVSYLVLIRRV